MPPEIRYAQADDAFIAYQEFGTGDRDILVIMEGFIPIDTMEDEPGFAERGAHSLKAFRAHGASAPSSRDVGRSRQGLRDLRRSRPVLASSPYGS
jgi:hypothetical protein